MGVWVIEDGRALANGRLYSHCVDTIYVGCNNLEIVRVPASTLQQLILRQFMKLLK